MLIFLINALKIIFLLAFIILIHEGGHFLVARLCKVKVKEFAIGFGKTIWQKKGAYTKYTIRLIPLRWVCKHASVKMKGLMKRVHITRLVYRKGF